MWVIFLLSAMIIFVCLFAAFYIGNKFLINIKKEWDKIEKEEKTNKEKEDDK